MPKRIVIGLACLAVIVGLALTETGAQALTSSCTYKRSVTFQNGNRQYAGDESHIRLLLAPLGSAITFSGNGGTKIQSITVTYADRNGSNQTAYTLSRIELKLHIWAAPIGKRISRADVCSS